MHGEGCTHCFSHSRQLSHFPTPPPQLGKLLLSEYLQEANSTKGFEEGKRLRIYSALNFIRMRTLAALASEALMFSFTR